MITPDIPAEAVEAGERALAFQSYVQLDDFTKERLVFTVLAAALPHLRERWLAEVEGALRDDGRFDDWFQADWQQRGWFGAHARGMVADYLRAALGAGAGGED
jgi:hypothetical protein